MHIMLYRLIGCCVIVRFEYTIERRTCEISGCHDILICREISMCQAVDVCVALILKNDNVHNVFIFITLTCN